MNTQQPDIPEKFLSPYNPRDTESRIYEMWETSGLFNPDESIAQGYTQPDAETFSIVLPPPNVTGQLHIGHAGMLAIEDIMVRFARMQGKRTLWIPGTDHAAIATQSKVEKILEKEKIRKHDLGREEFLRRVEEFAQNSHDSIVGQVRAMGASIDWSREAYTLDEQRHKAVYTAFERMYNDGLIYRDYRIVNWDPKGQTVISDDEVVHEERQATMYTFKYSADFPFAISTTRPETKVGDTAVAVHPDDPRYQEYIGQMFEVDFCGSKLSLKVIADEHVEMDLGTGALGVTPAHSIADWEMSQRHNVPVRQVISEYAKMIDCGDLVTGMKVAEAREYVAQWLRDQGLMINEEAIKQNLSTAERTGAAIEPMPKLQWWIDVTKKIKIPHAKMEGIDPEKEYSLKDLMLHVVDSEEIDIIPDYFKKTYYHWIRNLRPWNISRQIWYGHRIPVWYKDGEIKVSQETPGEGWVQDEDTLDTWFSSGLWTFSTLGWPHLDASDFKTYHPTNVLETGYDILPFWVARMVLMTTYLVGQVPFKTVYLHGLVRDEQGRKISKSLGNNIDPLEVIEQSGADALRMALTVGTAPGQDSKMSDNKIRAYSKFANKIWNVTRFILSATEGVSYDPSFIYSTQDQDLLKKQNDLIAEVTKEMEEYKYYLVGEKLYHYVWHEVADIILEESKAIAESGDVDAHLSRQQFLLHTLVTSLKLLHPFMPFITEEIWQTLPFTKDLLMVASWPKILK